MAKRKSKVKTVSLYLLTSLGNIILDLVKWIFQFLEKITLKTAPLIIVLLALMWFWENKVDANALKKFLSDEAHVLQEDQVARADLDCRDNSLTLQKEGEIPKRIVGIKTGTFIQNKDGSYEADYKNKGFGLEPGFVMTAGDGLRLGLDVEYAYWKRWGLLGGVTVPAYDRSLDKLRGHLGLGYDLPSKWLSHTSVYGGIDTNKTPTMGIRTKFGGGY